MKAVLKKDESKELLIIDTDIPKVKPDQVLVKVNTAGLCGTDVAIRNNTFMGRHGKVKYPLILGHELCGEVVELGSKAQRFKVGDRVYGGWIEWCGECYGCRIGMYHFCKNWVHIGIDSPGCFAEYIAVREDTLIRMPDFIPDEEGPVIEIATLAVRAFRDTPPEPGSFIVILGPGPFGLCLLQAALASGPNKVAITGLNSDEARLKIAKELGADVTINVDEEDAVERVFELSKGKGADIVVEATGNVKAVAQGLDMLAPGGTLLMGGSGFEGKHVSFAPWNVVRDQKTLKGLQGSCGRDEVLMEEWYKLGKLKIKSVMHPELFSLWDINRVCDLMETEKPLKIVMKP